MGTGVDGQHGGNDEMKIGWDERDDCRAVKQDSCDDSSHK